MQIVKFGKIAVVTAILVPPTAVCIDKFYMKTPERHEHPVKISELPIYHTPKERVVFVEDKPGFLQNVVSDVRETISPFIESTQETTSKIKEKVDVGVAHTKNLQTYIVETEGIIPKLSVISVSGLAGIVLGYKGGILRKATFGSLAMLTAASMCYPKEAVQITTDGYSRLKTAMKDAGIPLPEEKKDE